MAVFLQKIHTRATRYKKNYDCFECVCGVLMCAVRVCGCMWCVCGVYGVGVCGVRCVGVWVCGVAYAVHYKLIKLLILYVWCVCVLWCMCACVAKTACEFGTSRKTYEVRGRKVVRIARPKKRVDTRQASFHLTFCAGDQDVKPCVCFRGKPFVNKNGTVNPKKPKSTVLQRESFPNSINVYWQQNGYFDGATCLAYAKDFKRQAKWGPKLHQLDNLGGQSDPEFRQIMKEEADTLLAFTPPNCTDLAAACDAGLIKSVKDRIKAKFERDFEERVDDWTGGNITARMLNDLGEG